MHVEIEVHVRGRKAKPPGEKPSLYPSNRRLSNYIAILSPSYIYIHTYTHIHTHTTVHRLFRVESHRRNPREPTILTLAGFGSQQNFERGPRSNPTRKGRGVVRYSRRNYQYLRSSGGELAAHSRVVPPVFSSRALLPLSLSFCVASSKPLRVPTADGFCSVVSVIAVELSSKRVLPTWQSSKSSYAVVTTTHPGFLDSTDARLPPPRLIEERPFSDPPSPFVFLP